MSANPRGAASWDATEARERLEDVLVRVERAYLNEVAEKRQAEPAYTADEIMGVGAWLAAVSYDEWFALAEAYAKAEAENKRLREQLDAAQREVESQMQSKLDAQLTLVAVTEALDLRFNELGNGWREAAPKILARIETIVDEADRAFRERDSARAALGVEGAPGDSVSGHRSAAPDGAKEA